MSVTLDVELREERRRILSAVDGQLDDVVEAAVDAIRADIPIYADASRTLTEDVRHHVRAHYATKVACLGAEQPVTVDDLAFARAPASRRARAGLGLEDYINAFRVGHRVFWDAVLDCAGSGADGREAALTLATPLMRYCEVASTQAGHVFTETLQSALARAALGATRTLALAQQGEVVAVAPGAGSRQVCDRLEALHARLREEGVPLAFGVSLPAHGVAELPRAFAEARAALECVAGDGGVAALPLMSPLRFLTLSAPDTARRLVDPRLRTFLEQDQRRGGALRDTIRALAETDLKLGVAAARLQVHPNTLQYRVRRIQERTGRNPRRVADLLELLTAIALDDG
jgi:hypothetical protein